MSTDVAFIGAGNIAGIHLSNLEEIDRADVVAVCDIDEETAREGAEPHDAAVYTDYHDLYEEESFDAVFVCVPPFAHEDQELLAAEHGVDLFVEKPLGVEAATAHEIRDAVADAGIVTQVGHMNRYADIVEEARDVLADREIAVVEGRWVGGVPGTGWWGVKEKSGGQVVEQSTHVFDLVRYLAGDVAEVTAYGDQRVVEDAVDFEDASIAAMEHESGQPSQVTTSCAAIDGSVGLQVVAEDAFLDIDLGTDTLTGTVDGESIEVTNERAVFRDEIEAFLDAVEAGDPSLPRSPYADATKTFELTLAVNESLETGEPVEVR